MKDFDHKRKERAARDRTFVIGGESLVMRKGIRPEAMLPWEGITAESNPSEVLQTLDQIVCDFIEPADGARERYMQLRAREEDPLTLADLEELVEWLIAEQTGRPTGPPSVSGLSAVAPRTGSTGGSSLQEAPAA